MFGSHAHPHSHCAQGGGEGKREEGSTQLYYVGGGVRRFPQPWAAPWRGWGTRCFVAAWIPVFYRFLLL